MTVSAVELMPLTADSCTPRIDASLARAIRRAYFRELARQWERYVDTHRCAIVRNAGLNRMVKQEKQLRACIRQIEHMLGPLLPCASVYVDAHSRSAAVYLGLLPDPIPEQPKADSRARVMALMLMRPGKYNFRETVVQVSAHAVDRLIQSPGAIGSGAR